MIDMLASATIAGELLERTSSSMRVQRMVELSLTPAFLLAGIGAIMNVMMGRLIWIADRIERLEDKLREEKSAVVPLELQRLRRRRKLAQRAVMFSTGAALTICVVIALLFLSAFITPQIGTVTAIAWITSMAFLITGLVHFVLETVMAASAQKEAAARKQKTRKD
jgi:NhaP-type Na+/H+ or K+/H+ antiporter